MNDILPRNYEPIPGQRIRDIAAGAEEWQIGRTDQNQFALAVKDRLFQYWIAEYAMEKSLFRWDAQYKFWVFLSSGSYLISSLSAGPYPEDFCQIEAFSVTLNQFRKRFAELRMEDAVYIEEYSMLLPTCLSEDGDLEMQYGRWITGGVGVSIRNIDRVCEIMSWLPHEAVVQAAGHAGFCVDDVHREKKAGEVLKKPEPLLENYSGSIPQGKFTLPGRPELERFFNDQIVDVIQRSEEYKRMGITFPGATVLYGPPGCGKTYAVDRLTEFLGWKRFDIDSSSIASPYIHDTSRKISTVFQEAEAAAPSILVIDEMEAFLADRGAGLSSGVHHMEEVAEFLRRIPQAVSAGVLIFAMTNMLDAIDPAVVRRGRFDHMIEIKMPTAEEVLELLKIKFRKLPVDESVDITTLAGKLAGRPLSDTAFVLQEAGRKAVKNHLKFINHDCVADALMMLPDKKEKTAIGFRY